MSRREFDRFIEPVSGNNNGAYSRMETSKTDKTNFYRKPYYMIAGKQSDGVRFIKELSESN